MTKKNLRIIVARDGYVNVGRPSKAYSESGYPKEPWPGQVYLAFLNDDKVVYNWAWTKADTYNPDLPEGYEERFKGRIL